MVSPRAEPTGPISKIVAKIKDLVAIMFERVSADTTLAKKSVDSFLNHLPIKLENEIAQELSHEGIDPISKIVDKIVVKKLKELNGEHV